MRNPQASKLEESTTVTLNVINVPDMKGSANGPRRFRPMTMEIVYGPDPDPMVTIRGPWLVDGLTGPAWTTRRFFSNLAIDSGPRWIRAFVEDYRPNNRNSIYTSTLTTPEPIA